MPARYSYCDICSATSISEWFIMEYRQCQKCHTERYIKSNLNLQVQRQPTLLGFLYANLTIVWIISLEGPNKSGPLVQSLFYSASPSLQKAEMEFG